MTAEADASEKDRLILLPRAGEFLIQQRVADPDPFAFASEIIDRVGGDPDADCCIQRR